MLNKTYLPLNLLEYYGYSSSHECEEDGLLHPLLVCLQIQALSVTSSKLVVAHSGELLVVVVVPEGLLVVVAVVVVVAIVVVVVVQELAVVWEHPLLYLAISQLR